MEIKQWENKNLSHFSYAILSDCEKKIALIDPSRDPEPYITYAREQGAEIVAVFETHPHADFVSSHLEIHESTGAPIYVSKLVNAEYPHQQFDDGDSFQMGKIKLSAINTPGHSVDSISILLEYDGKQHAVFTGDTLFIGDCGRPDLRESAGNIKMNRKDQAKQMYHSLREKLMTLDDNVLVYPAHGAGTLCGKSLSEAHSSTIAEEKKTNWSVQNMSQEEFVNKLLTDQPFIPAYFPFDVEINRLGATPMRESINNVPYAGEINSQKNMPHLIENAWGVDVRKQSVFKQGHLPHSMNIMEDGKFETWLGSLIQPNESFYVVGEDEKQIKRVVKRIADIGYESQVISAYTLIKGSKYSPSFDVSAFKNNLDKYTIIDVRNASEVRENKIFSHSINIPLPEITRRQNEIPTDKPVAVHCAGGYRSAAGSSIIEDLLKGKQEVFDMSESIKQFEHKELIIT